MLINPFSAVFTWTNLLVVVVELEGNENEALDVVPLVTNCVLEEHFLIVGVVVVVDPGVVPINSRGEKQRMHLRDGFLADQVISGQKYICKLSLTGMCIANTQEFFSAYSWIQYSLLTICKTRRYT